MSTVEVSSIPLSYDIVELSYNSAVCPSVSVCPSLRLASCSRVLLNLISETLNDLQPASCCREPILSITEETGKGCVSSIAFVVNIQPGHHFLLVLPKHTFYVASSRTNKSSLITAVVVVTIVCICWSRSRHSATVRVLLLSLLVLLVVVVYTGVSVGALGELRKLSNTVVT